MQARDDDNWTCKLLSPPHSNCNTPQMRVETMGVHYAASVAEEEGVLGLDIWHGVSGQRGSRASKDKAKFKC